MRKLIYVLPLLLFFGCSNDGVNNNNQEAVAATSDAAKWGTITDPLTNKQYRCFFPYARYINQPFWCDPEPLKTP